MFKKGFIINHNIQNDSIDVAFVPRVKFRKKPVPIRQSVDFYQKNGARYFVFHTLDLDDYENGERRLIKSDFIYDKKRNIDKDSLILFQKRNISVLASIEVEDSIAKYTFKLKQRKIPDSVLYAEDLLQFDSNEFLVSYFGEKNVTNDLYYFSEKELKKCSVLFKGTLYQAAFVWGDENNLDNLSYVIVSNLLPTKDGKQNSIVNENNAWKFQNGIHHGMPLRDVLRLNEMDFDIYGNKSDFAFMVNPVNKGKLNFKKTALMFNCRDCSDASIFDQADISALDIVKAKLPMRVFDIIIYP
ncbi:MAG TPA: hypothetical protein VIJ92_10125 [Ginsengibacter sp.]